MDTVTLVETQIDDGQRLLDQLSDKDFVVKAACWVKPVEEDRWSLYLATPTVDEKGAAAAYRQVFGVLRSLGDAWITDSDIKLVIKPGTGPDGAILDGTLPQLTAERLYSVVRRMQEQVRKSVRMGNPKNPTGNL